MNGCLKAVAVVCLLIILVIAGVKVTQEIGVEHASRAEEQAILAQLPKASAREVLDAFFWGVNHHSEAVVLACKPCEENLFISVGRWQVLSVKEVKPVLPSSKQNQERERSFLVKMKNHNRYLCDDVPMTDGMIYEWTFELYRPKPGKQWLIRSFGYCSSDLTPKRLHAIIGKAHPISAHRTHVCCSKDNSVSVAASSIARYPRGFIVSCQFSALKTDN